MFWWGISGAFSNKFASSDALLDEKDLQAIAQMMDKNLSQQKQEILLEMDSKLEPIKSEITGIKLTLENVIQPQIDGLAENQQIILEKLVPRSRVDELEDEMKFLKVIIRQMNEDIQKLKAAN